MGGGQEIAAQRSRRSNQILQVIKKFCNPGQRSIVFKNGALWLDRDGSVGL
jgi:hypothetical protein